MRRLGRICRRCVSSEKTRERQQEMSILGNGGTFSMRLHRDVVNVPNAHVSERSSLHDGDPWTLLTSSQRVEG